MSYPTDESNEKQQLEEEGDDVQQQGEEREKNGKEAAGNELERAQSGVVVMRSGLKLKKGTMFKQKKRFDPRSIDLTIKKEEAGPRKTKAELAFLKRQEETAFERLSKRAAISHREKVERLNKQLEELTEFNDIPKVSWTK